MSEQKDLTPEELAELNRLEAAATPGPWFVDTGTPGHIKSSGDFSNIGKMDATPTVARYDVWSSHGTMPEGSSLEYWASLEPANAALIAAARNHLPRLIAMVERLQDERDKLRGEIDEFRHDHGYEKREW